MKLSHVAIAVKDLDAASRLYCESFGLKETHREEVPGQGVRAAFLEDLSGAGGCAVELLQPLGAEGGVAKFLASRGPGVHHLAFETPGLQSQMLRLKEAGRPTIEDKPRDGAHGHKVCFVHPKSTGGVLVELVEGGS